MAAFTYQAIDPSGRHHRGVVEAGTAAGARRVLRERALLPVSVEASHGVESSLAKKTAAESHGPGAVLAGFSLSRRRRGLSSRSLSTATRQLSTLVGGGVRVEEALRLVAMQGDAQPVAALLLDVRAAIIEGGSFASALARHPHVFPPFYRASVAAGETSGRLSDVLAYLAEFVEQRHNANQKILLALLYPALLASVSALMMTMMMIYVVPDIVRVFISHGTDLPFLTRLLIGMSKFVSRFGLVTLAATAGAAFIVRREMARPDRRLALDRFFATRRPFARFSNQANAARFASTLATLVQSAVPLLDSLVAAAAVVPNRYIRAQAEQVAVRVREGESVHRAMASTESFPPMLVAIVASGETGGQLGPALGRAATELDRDVSAQLAILVALVEPAVLLAMGGLVLLMVMAILMPIVGLNDLAIK